MITVVRLLRRPIRILNHCFYNETYFVYEAVLTSIGDEQNKMPGRGASRSVQLRKMGTAP